MTIVRDGLRRQEKSQIDDHAFDISARLGSILDPDWSDGADYSSITGAHLELAQGPVRST